MNEMMILVPVLSTILFLILRVSENMLFLENRYKYTIQIIIIDAIVVFFATFIGYWVVLHYLSPYLSHRKQTPITGNAEIFTDQPNF
jgi:hypothetical protein